MSIELIISLLGVILSVITIPFIISRMRMSSFKYHSLNLEHYEKLRDICDRNANDNLSTLLVALNGVIKKNLEPTLIEWFLYTPGAYFYIKKFDKCKRYISIDISNNKFIWNSKFKESKNRLKERILMFSVYTAFGTLGILPFIIREKNFRKLKYYSYRFII